MDWTALRNEFPVARHWAYLDHAAVAPLSGRARRALDAWADHLTENGVVNHAQWPRRAEEVRGVAARLLNAQTDEIAFIPSTSAGISLVAEGFPWKPGDNIVTAAEEYPANVYPWMNLAARGVELRRVPSRGPRVEIDDLRDAIDSRTRLLTLSHVEFASGFRNDLDAIGGLCRERGILFFVDAIQSLGVLPIDVRRSPIDFLAADGHKWLVSPEGMGVFFLRRELLEFLHPVGIGWNSVVGALDFTRIDFTLKPSAARWEGGSLNFAGLTALGGSLELLLDVGIDALKDRVLMLTDHLCEQAKRAGLTVFSSRADRDRSGIVSLMPPADADPLTLVRRAREARFVINQRAARLRVSPHAYNSLEEIDALVEFLLKAVH